MATLAHELITPEMFDRMPDTRGFELIDGELREKSMGYDSCGVAMSIGAILYQFCVPRLGAVQGSYLMFFIWPDRPNTGRKPDVSFIPLDRCPSEPLLGHTTIVPYLAVEVVSPSNSAEEIATKVEEYLAAGVSVVWVVYTTLRVVTVYEGTERTQTLRGNDVLKGTGPLAGLEIPLPSIFVQIAMNKK